MARLVVAGRPVFVTGAASGLGEEIARRLAREGAVVIITDRRELPVQHKLMTLKAELIELGASGVECFPADLDKPAEVVRLCHTLSRFPLAAAVLNAGMTHADAHLDATPSIITQMVSVNVSAPLVMANMLAPTIIEQEGAIMFVSSLAGVTGLPLQAAYSGTKAALIKFFAGLESELRDSGMSLTLFLPGGILTQMYYGTSLCRVIPEDSRSMMHPVVCARYAVDGMLKRKRRVVPGRLNNLLYTAGYVLPRDLIHLVLRKTYKVKERLKERRQRKEISA